jgi:iduronate 2-sulfatase
MKYCLSHLMSIRLFAVAMFLCGALLVCTDVGAAEYDVYILAGQSNMDGRGDVQDLPKVLKSKQPGVLIYYTHPADPKKDGEKPTQSDAWQRLAPGYSVPTRSRRISLPSKTFGPEVSFGHAIQKTLGGDRAVAIIKVTRGGTNLRSDWSPDGFMYQSLITTVNDAMAALKKAGHEGEIRGVLWHQGESDSRRLDEYQGELETLIANTRKAVGKPELPFLIGELAPTKPAAFRALQKTIADENDRVVLVRSVSLKTKDKTHFDAASQVEIGKRFAKAMAGLLAKPPQ